MITEERLWQLAVPTILIIIAVMRGMIWQGLIRVFTPVRFILHYYYCKIPFIRDINKLKTQMLEIAELKNMISDVLTNQESFRKEFTINGGATIKDDLNGIRTGIKRLFGRQKIDINKPVVIFNDASFLTEANDVFLSLVGRPFAEIQGKNWYNCVHRDDRQAVQKEWLDALMNRRTSEMEYRLQSSDGKAINAKAISVPTLSSKGDVLEFITTFKILN